MEQNKDFEILIDFLKGLAVVGATAFVGKQLKDNPDALKSIFSMFGLKNLIDTEDDK